MRVWVTRSEPGASRTAAHLATAGHQPLVVPVVAIQALAVEPKSLGQQTGPISDVIFLSEHAVVPGVELMQRAGIKLGGLRAFAIGPQTAACLTALGVQPIVPAVASSEGLLACSELVALSNRTLAIFAGEGGRERLREGLEQRGGSVVRCPLYRRVPVPVDEVRAALEPAVIEAIAVSSGDGFRWAAQVWFAARGRPRVPVLTPSQRVSDMAHGLGFAQAYTCEGAGAEALLAGLAKVTGT